MVFIRLEQNKLKPHENAGQNFDYFPVNMAKEFDKTFKKYCMNNDCMKSFCKGLREHATKMLSLTKEEKKWHSRQELCKK